MKRTHTRLYTYSISLIRLILRPYEVLQIINFKAPEMMLRVRFGRYVRATGWTLAENVVVGLTLCAW